jgi:hypothetical protein
MQLLLWARFVAVSLVLIRSGFPAAVLRWKRSGWPRPEPGQEGHRMAVRLNRKALANARKLIAAGKVVRDVRDDWSEHAPSTEQENTFIDKNGFGHFAEWHLGLDGDKSEGTKGSVSFPFGDFSKVHRCAVISLESRAGQYGHDDIRDAARKLLDLMDSD